jgi:hypothetical protein
MTYEVRDNFLDKTIFDGIAQSIEDKDFPWYFLENIGFSNDKSDVGFIHLLYMHYTPNSPLFVPIMSPIIELVNPNAIIRCRVSSYLKGKELIEHQSHVDYSFPHKVFMLYINTNNGYTTFEDGTKVNCVANRAVFFDGSKPHHSSNCTDQNRRFVLTMNYF